MIDVSVHQSLLIQTPQPILDSGVGDTFIQPRLGEDDSTAVCHFSPGRSEAVLGCLIYW